MPPAMGLATSAVLVALVGRLLSDRKHNKRQRQRGAPVAQPMLPQSAHSTAREARTAVRRGVVTANQSWLATGLLLAFCTILIVFRGKLQASAGAMLFLCIAFFVVALYLCQRPSDQEALGGDQGSSPETLESAVRQNLTGTWIKDKRASEDMSRAIELAQLNRITRTAVRLIRGLQIVDSRESFDMAVFSVVGWFKVREVYPTNGEVCKQKRRDLRRGHHKGRFVATPAGHPRLEYEWPDPVGGHGHDEFQLAAPGVLHVSSRVDIGGEVAEYTTVYRKR